MVTKQPKKRGPKPKAEKEQMRRNIFERPNFLNSLPTKGGKGTEIAKLSEKLNYCTATEAVIYTEEEFKIKFFVKVKIPQELNYIKNQLRLVHKKLKVRSYHDQETQKVYFWENGKIGK